MAKSRSHRGSRDDDFVSTEPTWSVRPSLVSYYLEPIHDLRTFHPYRDLLSALEISPSTPGQWRQARTNLVPSRFSGVGRTDRMGNPVRVLKSSRAIEVFARPERVPVCVRRQQRREVLFARGKNGRGYKRPRWTRRSYERCK